MRVMTPQQEILLDQFTLDIFHERVRAHEKHGATSMEQAGLLEHRRASILTEEAVESAKALNDHEHSEIKLYEGVAEDVTVQDALDKELIQTAAMAYTWWANRRGDRLPAPSQRGLRDDVRDVLERVAEMQTGRDAFVPVDIIMKAREILGVL